MKLNTLPYFLLFFLIFCLISCGKKNIYNDVNLKTSYYNYSNYNIKFSTEVKGDSYISYWALDSDTIFNSLISKNKKVHDIPLLFLKPSVKYNFTISTSYNNSNYTSKLFSFTTRDFPETLPSFDLEINNYKFDGYVFLRTQTNPGIQLLIDSKARPIWYSIADSVLSRPFNTINSSSYISLSKANLIHEISFVGDTILSIDTKENILHHDILKYENKYIGLTYKYFELKNDPKISSLKGDGIVVYDSIGNLLWEWNIFDFINPKKSSNEYLIQEDWSHANAISVDYDGNFLLSFRSFNQVWKVNSTNGNIIWKLGINGDFKLSKEDIFYQQHAIHKIDEKKYMLFDNGDSKIRKSSRALIFSLDESNKKFDLINSVFLPDDLFSFKQGSVYLFNNDKLLFTSTVNSRVVITNMKGEVLWNLKSDNSFYRAYYLDKLL